MKISFFPSFSQFFRLVIMSKFLLIWIAFFLPPYRYHRCVPFAWWDCECNQWIFRESTEAPRSKDRIFIGQPTNQQTNHFQPPSIANVKKGGGAGEVEEGVRTSWRTGQWICWVVVVVMVGEGGVAGWWLVERGAWQRQGGCWREGGVAGRKFNARFVLVFGVYSGLGTSLRKYFFSCSHFLVQLRLKKRPFFWKITQQGWWYAFVAGKFVVIFSPGRGGSFNCCYGCCEGSVFVCSTDCFFRCESFSIIDPSLLDPYWVCNLPFGWMVRWPVGWLVSWSAIIS